LFMEGTTGTNIINLNINLGTPLTPEDRFFDVDPAGAQLIINGGLSGGGFNMRFAKAGPGKLVLAGANTYHPDLTSVGGILNIRNSSGLGGDTNVGDGGTLQLEGGVTITHRVTIDTSQQATGTPAIWSVSGVNTLSGLVQIGTEAIVDENVVQVD